MSDLAWPHDAATIIKWAEGRWVNTDKLVAELDAWSNHFASGAALWPDSTAQRQHVVIGP